MFLLLICKLFTQCITAEHSRNPLQASPILDLFCAILPKFALLSELPHDVLNRMDVGFVSLCWWHNDRQRNDQGSAGLMRKLR